MLYAAVGYMQATVQKMLRSYGIMVYWTRCLRNWSDLQWICLCLIVQLAENVAIRRYCGWENFMDHLITNEYTAKQ